jgi:integrase
VAKRPKLPKWLLWHKLSPYIAYEFWLNGRPFRGSTKTKDIKDAQRIVKEIRRQALLVGLEDETQPMSLNEAFGRYQIEVADLRKDGAEVQARLARLMTYLGKDRCLHEIKTADLIGFISERRAMPIRGKLVGPRTINLDINTYRSVWQRAKEGWERKVGKEPSWKTLHQTEPSGRSRYLSEAEQERLLAQLPDDLGVMVAFALVAGGRLQSCLSLEWRDVDEATGWITFRNVKSRRTGLAHRVPIDEVIQALLETRRGQHGRFVFTYPRKLRIGEVAAGERVPFTKGGWRKPWKAALAAAAIEDFRFHDTRHTAGTRIADATGDITMSRDLLGQSSLKMAERYAHVIRSRRVLEGMQRVSSRKLPVNEKGQPGSRPFSDPKTNT